MLVLRAGGGGHGPAEERKGSTGDNDERGVGDDEVRMDALLDHLLLLKEGLLCVW